MNILKSSKPILSAALAAALVLLSPGLPAYQAFAGGFQSAGGRAGLPPGGPMPMLQALSSPDALARLGNQVVRGVEIGPVLSGLSKLDLTGPQGQAAVADVARALRDLPPGSPEWMALEKIANVAALERSNAQTWLQVSNNPNLDDKALTSLHGRLQSLEASSFLLDAGTRVKVNLAYQRAGAELERRKMSGIETKIETAAKSWEKSGPGAVEETGVSGRESRNASGLTKNDGRGSRRDVLRSKLNLKRAELSALRQQKAAAKPLPWWNLVGVVSIAFAAATLTVAPAMFAIGAGVVGSILLHETAHLWALRKLGDDTAALHGVTTLNPFKLVDPLKTVLLPLVTLTASTLLLGVPLIFGAAKPVPVDFNKLADPKRDAAKVAIAGPAMNVILAALFFGASLAFPGVAALGLLWKVNVALAAFNMLPLPQMDGGKVLIGFMPKKLYEKWVVNDKVAQPYQGIFRKMYEGPSALLNAIGMTGQGSVNNTTRAITWGVFAAFAAASYLVGGLPILLLMLVCSYDYYCIREKIQNENAVRQLMDLMLGFASDIAAMQKEGFGIKSKINTEKVEHSLKNALEDTIDQVVDSEGFDALDADAKWKRLEDAYLDAAVVALKKEGMRHDDPETIRRVLTSPRGRAFLDKLKQWVKEHEVFEKWHSEGRKQKLKDAVKGKLTEKGGQVMGMLLMGALGGQMLGAGAFMMGTVEQTERPATPTFEDAMKDASLQLSPKEQGFLSLMLSEMKLEEKPPVVGRVDEMGKVYKNITAPRGDINSVILVGKAGTGKTAVPEKLAQSIALSEAAPGGAFELLKMRGRFLVKLNLARLLTQDDPAKSLDLLLQLLGKFNEANKRSGNKVVLFVDEVHQLFAHAKGDQMANLLKEPLRDGSLSIIAATTDAEYKKYMENDEAFRRRMFLIRVSEATIPETMRMLQGSKAYYEGLYELSIDPEAMKAAAEMSKFDQEVFLPGRAFKYLLLAAKEADFDGQRDRLTIAISDKMSDLQYVSERLEQELKMTPTVTEKLKKDEPTTIELYNLAIQLTKELVGLYRRRAAIPMDGKPVVTADLVKDEIATNTGVAAGQLTLGQEPVDKYLKMEETLNQRVIGQPDAVHAISEAVRQNKAGLSDPNLPIARLLFTGPTGTGKTHLTKEVARFLFGDPNAVHRFDMSEYMESHSVSRFTGAPPGYVGFAEGGQLTEAVRKKPYSVVLLDEIEKAHPDVFDILLQILGDGRLTDGQGRTTDFKNTIIVMTSNLGMSALNDLLDEYVAKWQELNEQADAAKGDALKLAEIKLAKKALSQELASETKRVATAVTKEAMKKAFKPEFEGRLSVPPVVFERISPENAPKIVDLNMKDLKAILAQAGHELSWTPQAVDLIAEKGFDIRLGARPLKTAIDRMVTQQIAQAILESAKTHGGRVPSSKIEASVVGDKIKVTVSPLPPKKVSKTEPEEGAAEAVFTKVLNSSLQAAAGQAVEQMTLETIDSWVREALTAFPDSAEEIPAPQVKNDKPAAQTTVEMIEKDQPKAEKYVGVFRPSTKTVVSPASVTGKTENYEYDMVDEGVESFRTQLVGFLQADGWPQERIDVLVRELEDPANPYTGWLDQFVELAKQNTPTDRRATPIGLSFVLEGDVVRVVIHRNGQMNDRELDTLKRHFAGLPPVTPRQSRDDAESLVVRGKEGRRLFFDLHRQLAKIPGAQLGFATGKDAQGGAGTDYWIEITKPAPPPVPPAPEPAQEEQQAPDTERTAANDQPNTPAYGGFELARTATAPELEFNRKLSKGLNAGNDSDVHSVHGSLTALMTQRGYSREERLAAAAFLNAGSDFAKRLADRPSDEVEARWSVDEDATRVMIQVDPGGLSEIQYSQLAAKLREEAILPTLEAARAKLLVREHDGKLQYWLEIPKTSSSAQAQADGAASNGGATAPSSETASSGHVSPRAFAILDHRARNEEDPAFLEARRQLIALNPGGTVASGHRLALIAKFLDRAARFGKEKARENPGERLTMAWKLENGKLEISMRRTRQGQFFNRSAWKESVRDEQGVVAWLEDLNATLEMSGERIEKKKHAEVITLTIPLDGPEPVVVPESTGDAARDRARKIAYAIIAQAHERGATVRVAAIDLLGAASTPEDLAKAREWGALTDADRWAHIGAAAVIIAAQGSREQDSETLKRLMKLYGQSYVPHEKLPARRRLIEAFATVNATDNPARIRQLMQDYDAVKAAGGENKAQLEALYMTLARYGDGQARQLLIENWEPEKAHFLAEYLLRVDPSYMWRLYQAWSSTKDAPDGMDRPLTLWAIAAYGNRGDLQPFLKMFREKRFGSGFDGKTVPPAAEAFSRFVARIGAGGDVELKAELRDWLQEDISTDNTLSHVITAVMVKGETGVEADLAELERIMAIDPSNHSTVSNYHEMTQHEAGVAWAKIVHREGLLNRYLTEMLPAANGLPAMPKIQRMLLDTNGVINKAALEAMRYLFVEPDQGFIRNAAAPTGGTPQAGPAPEGGPAPGPAAARAPRVNAGLASHWLFEEGPENTQGNMGTSWHYTEAIPGVNLDAAVLAAADSWLAAFRAVAVQVFGTPFDRFVKVVQDSSGVTVVWTARQAQTETINGMKAQRFRELVYVLLHLMEQPQSIQFFRLAELEREVPGARAAFTALQAIAAPLAFRMGFDVNPARANQPQRGETEIWLRLKFRRGSSRPPDGPGDAGDAALLPTYRPTPVAVDHGDRGRGRSLAAAKNEMLERRRNRDIFPL